jgi:hypothetical protein
MIVFIRHHVPLTIAITIAVGALLAITTTITITTQGKETAKA